jgi:hypothetical protein
MRENAAGPVVVALRYGFDYYRLTLCLAAPQAYAERRWRPLR